MRADTFLERKRGNEFNGTIAIPLQANGDTGNTLASFFRTPRALPISDYGKIQIIQARPQGCQNRGRACIRTQGIEKREGQGDFSGQKSGRVETGRKIQNHSRPKEESGQGRPNRTSRPQEVRSDPGSRGEDSI
jgi:hypothetical protein